MVPKAGMRWRQNVSMETTGRKGRERERDGTLLSGKKSKTAHVGWNQAEDSV